MTIIRILFNFESIKDGSKIKADLYFSFDFKNELKSSSIFDVRFLQR